MELFWKFTLQLTWSINLKKFEIWTNQLRPSALMRGRKREIHFIISANGAELYPLLLAFSINHTANSLMC